MAPTEDTTAGTGAGSVDQTTDEQYELLADERRRLALSVLADRPTPVDLSALAASVAGREADGEPADGAADEVAMALHHRHLPKLDEAAVLDYEPASRTVGGTGQSIQSLAARATDERTTDEVASALAATTRLHVLRYFDATAEEAASLDDLAAFVAERGADSVRRSHKQVRARLHHADLPKLADADLVRYDPGENTVTRTELGQTLTPNADAELASVELPV